MEARRKGVLRGSCAQGVGRNGSICGKREAVIVPCCRKTSQIVHRTSALPTDPNIRLKCLDGQSPLPWQSSLPIYMIAKIARRHGKALTLRICNADQVTGDEGWSTYAHPALPEGQQYRQHEHRVSHCFQRTKRKSMLRQR